MKNTLHLKKFRTKNLFHKRNEVIKKVAVFMSLVLPIAFCSCENTSSEPEIIPAQEETFFDVQGENGFVGEVEGTNAFVSILLGTEAGIAYVCNGEENISEWFKGPVSDLKEIYFTNSAGAKITASLIDNSFQGEITFKDGTPYPFTAAVNSGIYGGIYRVIDEKAEKAEIKAGWIVRSEEDQRGAIIFQSRALPNIPLRKKNFEDIKDGSSNTISIKGASFSIFRYKIEVSLPTPPGVPIPYPNIG